MSYAPIYSDQLLHDHSPASINHIASKTNPSAKSSRRKPASGRGPRTAAASNYPIIVHCHLSWDWVWQRPQQFISRLSKNHRVLFVETSNPDPELAAPLARFRALADFPNITILRLQFPAWCWQDGARIDRERRRLVQEFVAGPMAGQFNNPVQWFYDPMAVTAFLGQMDERLTVYDCMDELSKFAGAPPQLLERELELLEQAEVVFTGGRKLFESRSRLNPNCHFYGCGVEGRHFGQARLPQTQVPPELAGLPKPVLGYFGVVDERMDYELLSRLADANPNWSVAMVGPVLKVEQRALPRRANLHWFGQRRYEELPALCKGFDVCLMPFALNASTEFINPTKALEYMATGKPIVSTAVPDVITNFGSVIRIAHSGEEFIGLCRQALDEPDATRLERGLQMAAGHSWDSIVASLERHVIEALAKKQFKAA